MKTLFLIPARGGSKGIPGKAIKKLGGKPLIWYTLELAKALAHEEDICVSTDDQKIVDSVIAFGLNVPFIRPAHLATDEAGMQGVMKHALNHYAEKGILYDRLVLLQPTSPFRTLRQVKEAMDLYTPDLDMVVSVKETEVNPYYLHYVENENGKIEKLLQGDFTTRQSVPTVYELNGAIYVIRPDAIQKMPRSAFQQVKKYEMDALRSLDLDTPLDWDFAEMLIKKNRLND